MTRKRYKRKPFKPIDYDRFKDTRILAGLSKRQVASMLFVSLRTIDLWETGKVRIPYAAFRLLRILTGYELPGRAWQGFYLHGDTLWSPEGKPFKAADLGYLSVTFAMARMWREDYARRAQARQATAEDAEHREAVPALRLVSGVES
ncbi:MAG: VC1465 family Xer recombination activation factor [Pseudomonadota bacterium]